MPGQPRWWQRFFGQHSSRPELSPASPVVGATASTGAEHRAPLADSTEPSPTPAGTMLHWTWWWSLVLVVVISRLLPYALPKLLSWLVPGVDGRQAAYYLFNVTPVGAACVFAGAVLASRRQVVLLPLTALLVSDVLLTMTGWAPIPGIRVALAGPLLVHVEMENVASLARHVGIQYSLFLAMSGLGRWWLYRRRNTARVLGTCLVSGLLFWFVADGQVWWFSPSAPLPPDMPESYWGRLLYAFSPEAFLQLRGYPKTLDGLVTCYLMGLPFSLRFIASTMAFGWVFFLAYAWAVHTVVGWQSWGQTQPTPASR